MFKKGVREVPHFVDAPLGNGKYRSGSFAMVNMGITIIVYETAVIKDCNLDYGLEILDAG